MINRIIIVLLLLLNLFFASQETLALDYSRISTNTKIIAALNSLDSINRRDVIAILYGRNATRKPIRVLFRNFAMLGYNNCEAVTVKTNNNGLVIYINSEHKNASPECIACLLAHEAQHHTFTNSKTEELRAWLSEIQAWNELCRRNKNLATLNEPLVKRERYLTKVKTRTGMAGIKNIIATNPIYADLN